MFRETAMGVVMALTLGIPAWAAGTGPNLSPMQADRLKSRYPDGQVVRLCTGRFGGLNPHDAVMGVLSKDVAHRLALIWDGREWVLHDVDTELKQDKRLSRSLPMRWNYSVTGSPQQDFRCDFRLGKDDRIGTEGDKPLFDLKARGLEQATAVCFETDKTYNNWDCVVYSPKDRRFRLWFQQAHAD